MQDCIEWTGATNNRGYGYASINGILKGVHVHEWEKHNGPVPVGRVVMHRCDNPPCYFIGHLGLGTQKENIEDARLKGRIDSSFFTDEECISIAKLYTEVHEVLVGHTLVTRRRYTYAQIAAMYGYDFKPYLAMNAVKRGRLLLRNS